MPVDLNRINSDLQTSSRLWGAIGVAAGAFGIKLAHLNHLYEAFRPHETLSAKLQVEILRVREKESKFAADIVRSGERENVLKGQRVLIENRLATIRAEEANLLRRIEETRGEDKRRKLRLEHLTLLTRQDAALERQANVERELTSELRGRLGIEGQLEDVRERMAHVAIDRPLALFEDRVRSATRWLAPSTGAIALMGRNAWDFNRALQQANSSLEVRNNLFRSSLAIQVRTGLETRSLLGAYVALRNQGQLYAKDLSSAASAVAMLHEGLDVSLETGAELVAVSRALGSSFSRVADVIATVVDNTALTGQQVAEIAKALSQMAYGYGFRGSDIAGSTRLIAALQDQLQQLGVEGRDVASNLILGLSDMRKLGGLGLAFGATPGLAGQGPERIRMVIGNVGQFLRQFQGNQWVFPQMAEMFGMTVDQARALIESLPKLNQAERQLQDSRISLEQRYRNQSIASGKVLGQFTASLKSLLLEVLTPLLPAIQKVTAWMDSLRRELIKLGGLPTGVKETIRWVGAGALGVTALGGMFKLFGAFQAGGGLFHLLGRLVGLGGAGAAAGGVEAVAGGAAVRAGLGGALSRVSMQALGRSVAASLGADAATMGTLAASALGALATAGIVAELAVIAYQVNKYLTLKESAKSQADVLRGIRLSTGQTLLDAHRRDLIDILFTHGRQKDVFGTFKAHFDQEMAQVMDMVKRGQVSMSEAMAFETDAMEMLQSRRAGIAATLSDPYAVSAEERRQLLRDNDTIIGLLTEIASHAGATAGAIGNAAREGRKNTQDAANEEDRLGTVPSLAEGLSNVLSGTPPARGADTRWFPGWRTSPLGKIFSGSAAGR